MRPLEPFASSKHVLIKSSIKKHYKCAPRSPPRLRGNFLFNPLFKIITNASLGPLRVYEEISFQAPY